MRKRSNRVVFYLDDKELKYLNKNCAVSGMRREQFLRQMIMGVELKPRPPDSYKELTRELSAIGNNINQIAHLANSTGQAQQIGVAVSLVQQIWQLVRERV
jgi:hypothetical protein